MEIDRFAHLTGRQKAACYFIMKTLNVYLKDNETPEEFLNKYLKKAKIKAGWKNPDRKANSYSVPYLSLESINKDGIEYEEDLRSEMLEYTGLEFWKD